jgi:nucleoside-diphosphate-sugar epimerase
MATKGWVVVPRSANELQPVYVDDVASATMRALHASAPAEPLPVAHSALHSWPVLATALGEAVGRPGRMIRVPSGVFWTAGLISEVGSAMTGKLPAMDRRKARDLSQRRWTCDVEGTQTSLVWTPEVDIREGLARTAAWYREHGWL